MAGTRLGLASREPELSIIHAKAHQAAAARAFHVQNIGAFMWPRDEAAFAELIDGRELFLLVDRGRIRGLCYCTPGDERWEFGGIYVDEALRGRGAAAALGRVAIGLQYAHSQPPQLIAHVHEFNDAPRNLLTEQLGFRATGIREIPPVAPPASMQRNGDGDVVGDLFEFDPARLHAFADWLETFDGWLSGKDEAIRTSLSLPGDFTHRRGVVVASLRHRAARAGA